MEENHPTIEAVLSAHGVGDEPVELARGARRPEAINAIIEDVQLIRPRQAHKIRALQENSHPYHKCTRQEART